jgi:hypothetical protein
MNPVSDPPANEGAPSFSLKVRCAQCGAVQEVALEGRDTICEGCSQPLPRAAGTPAGPDASGSPGPGFRLTNQTRETLAELMKRGPGPEILGVITEILTFHRRLASLSAFLPLLGPWLVARSEDRPQHKRRLLYLSVGVTGLTIVGAVALVRWVSGPPIPLPERVQSQIRVLGTIVRAFRETHGAYPDAATWKRTAEQPDSRFFDPWSRPYRYEQTEDGGVAIGTLGRDGVAGGADEDADVAIHFTPTGPVASKN